MSEAANAIETPMIEGRYRIIRKIADGGMASVYEAMDERLERTVAIKIMHTQLAQGPHRAQFVERFRREAKSAAAIANPHIVQVYDTGEVNGLDYLVMEFVHGVNLRREMNEEGTFTVRETLRIVGETLDGLASAHRAGVVHRDIKPENILLNDRGHVQITDFGLAKAASQATLSSTGMLLGTAAYLAPEMIESNQATPQGDLYSVGIMAWEMLAGTVPFTSDNPVTLVFKHVHEDVPPITVPCPGIDPKVAAFVAHLTARAVEDRPADAGVAADELRALGPKLDMAAWTYRRMPQSAEDHDTVAVPVASAGEAAGAGAVSAAPPLPPSDSAHDGAGADVSSGNGSDDAGSASDTSGAATTAFDRPADGTAPTTAIGTAATQALSMVPDAVESPLKVGAKRKSKKTLAAVLAALAAVAVLGGAGGGYAWWYYRGAGSYWQLPQPTDVACEEGQSCRIIGANWAKYKKTLETAGIPYQATERYDDTVAKGDVIEATPAVVGSHVSKRTGGTVSVVVSKGVKQATVPSDIFDANTTDGTNVLDALKKAGFTNVAHDESNDQYDLSLPAGALIGLTDESGAAVQAGSTMNHNAKLTVVLSKGLMPVTMPDVVGMTKDAMTAALDEIHVTANVTEQYDDKIPSGSVVSASEQAGAELYWGDSVDVVISKGPETAKIPNLVGKTKSAATKTLQELGFEVKTSGLDILGLVQQQSASGETRLRDEDGNKTVVTLTIV
ncbi:protein kinase domain-containing protein [Bifidobacterium biavatii]|uniref:non-specific serine/threonine protein kinase n=1 Tax=Bifidobacterium biavatii DSM 23969 TaxID=1437608 RepID=A0A086ZL84_9BIFI|nr:protein kinase [Bifidobacterium biavatii]KFI47284.1 serine/threonine protein kinase [Bifidobacterium biavatii DSM 23969]